MHRAINVASGRNPVTYKLSGLDEFTILAVSCVFHAKAHNPPYGFPTFEWRDANAGLIYRQTLNTLLNDEVGVAGSMGGEPFYKSNNGPYGFPQANEQQSNAGMTIRLPQITLTPHCTFGAYVSKSVRTGNEQPAGFFINTDYEVLDLHLWVEDVAGRHELPPNPPPLLTHEL